MAAHSYALTELESACGVTLDAVRTFTLTSTVTGDMAVIDAHASPAEAGATARYLLGAPVEFSHLGMGAYPVYRKRAE